MGVQECSEGVFTPSPLMLRWIYPGVCELCHEPSEQQLCESCVAKLPAVPLPICLYCGSSVAGEQVDPMRCSACSAAPRYFTFARSVFMTDENTRRLVHALKYHHANYLAPVMGELLNRLWEDTPQLMQAGRYCIVPVPISHRHLFARGYNQAEELARTLAHLRRLPVCCALRRLPTGVESQTHLSAGERRRNAMRAYAAKAAYASGRRRLPGEDFVLVDDVYTTGSTAQACAKALFKLPGVRRVGVLTLLRAGGRRERI